MTDKLAIPTVHMNGTLGRDLFDALIKARQSIYDAIEAVQATAPNGRDYYPQGPQAITLAVEQHGARLAALDKINRELEAIVIALDEQT